jgi:hypothetical protein
VVMFGLYIWSTITAKRVITKHVQPHIDNLFGTHPRTPEAKTKQ